MVFQAEALTRRGRFTWLIAGALLLLLGLSAARAGVDDLVKAAAWRFGDQLSLAAFLYAQGGQEDNVEQLLFSTKPLAEAMEIEIKPFPPRAATSTETYADIIHYLIEGDGAEIGRELSRKFGSDAGTLYEVSVKSNLLLLLYQPGDDQGIGGMIHSRLSEIGLPENLWMGVVNAINDKAPQGAVKDAIFKMHDDVAAYLGEQAQ
jgi:hypothetical protein